MITDTVFTVQLQAFSVVGQRRGDSFHVRIFENSFFLIFGILFSTKELIVLNTSATNSKTLKKLPTWRFVAMCVSKGVSIHKRERAEFIDDKTAMR